MSCLSWCNVESSGGLSWRETRSEIHEWPASWSSHLNSLVHCPSNKFFTEALLYYSCIIHRSTEIGGRYREKNCIRKWEESDRCAICVATGGRIEIWERGETTVGKGNCCGERRKGMASSSVWDRKIPIIDYFLVSVEGVSSIFSLGVSFVSWEIRRITFAKMIIKYTDRWTLFRASLERTLAPEIHKVSAK